MSDYIYNPRKKEHHNLVIQLILDTQKLRRKVILYQIYGCLIICQKKCPLKKGYSSVVEGGLHSRLVFFFMWGTAL